MNQYDLSNKLDAIIKEAIDAGMHPYLVSNALFHASLRALDGVSDANISGYRAVMYSYSRAIQSKLGEADRRDHSIH